MLESFDRGRRHLAQNRKDVSPDRAGRAREEWCSVKNSLLSGTAKTSHKVNSPTGLAKAARRHAQVIVSAKAVSISEVGPISDMEAGQASRTPAVEQAPAAREQPAEADGARLGEQPPAADEAPQPLLARGHEPPAAGEA
jgi:hypothetical protein